MEDDRFKGLFSKNEYAIDKSNPDYHRHHPNEASERENVVIEQKQHKEDNAIRIIKHQVKHSIKKTHWKYNKTENLTKRVAISAKTILQKPKKHMKAA